MNALTLIVAYLLIGFGFYLGLAVGRLRKFKGVSTLALIKGILLGVLCWPIAAAFKELSKYYDEMV